MGTSYTIKAIGKNINTDNTQDSITSILDRINHEMSTYIDTSVISMFNESTIKDSTRVGNDFIHILNKSIYYNDITNGAFDITVKPFVELWGFGAAGSLDSIPTDQEIDNLLSYIGIDNIIINKNYLHKIGDVNVDFSAIAKGYAVDEISSYLNRMDIQNHMVEIGGELKVSGSNRDGNSWLIGLQDPNKNEVSPLVNITLTDKGMATSGNYRNYYTVNGKKYAHIISPITGRPIKNNILSVTVISDDCLDADALATALMVMNTDQGLKLIENLEDTEAFYTLENNKILYSSGFKSFIR
tara:strand:+ start:569 stop:1465 length:897 start_codon:yes stop_codon:yes gene_type:complete